MRAVILAAGQGTRLRPYTNHQPKCMVSCQGKPIIDHILTTMRNCGVDDISIVGGYKKDVLERHLQSWKVRLHANEHFDCTNMVYSLFCAEEEMSSDDIIISYADIIYSDKVLQKLMDSPAGFSVVVDRDWEKLWRIRMAEPLSDAETLRLGEDGNIIELGQKPQSYDEIEGQYVGLIKISQKALPEICDFYNHLDRVDTYDGKNFDNMYMTNFIQLVIERLMPVKAIVVHGGWLEIDSIQDLERYEQLPLILSRGL